MARNINHNVLYTTQHMKIIFLKLQEHVKYVLYKFHRLSQHYEHVFEPLINAVHNSGSQVCNLDNRLNLKECSRFPMLLTNTVGVTVGWVNADSGYRVALSTFNIRY